MCQNQDFLFDSLNMYFGLLKYNYELLSAVVAKGSTNLST